MGAIGVSDLRDDDASGTGAQASDRVPGSVGGDVELTVVTMVFEAADDDALLAVLARYVVLTRMADGCRNVDLCASVTRPGRHLIVQKWTTPAAQRAHFDSALMVDMARECTGLLRAPPDIDLWEGASAHDLR
jgi:quinol monooxygenase YgiN